MRLFVVASAFIVSSATAAVLPSEAHSRPDSQSISVTSAQNEGSSYRDALTQRLIEVAHGEIDSLWHVTLADTRIDTSTIQITDEAGAAYRILGRNDLRLPGGNTRSEFVLLGPRQPQSLVIHVGDRLTIAPVKP